jgi:hypothetical protein
MTSCNILVEILAWKEKEPWSSAKGRTLRQPLVLYIVAQFQKNKTPPPKLSAPSQEARVKMS